MRLEFLDGLRALAALAVVLHHAQLEVWNETHSRTRYVGRLAVDVFIVLSGFCLMLPVVRSGGLRGGALRFLQRRARRILPPYYAAVGLSLVLIWTLIGHKTGTLWDVSYHTGWHGVMVHAMLLQDVLHRGEINYALWSVAVEWKIYLLFPLLLVVDRRAGTLLTTALAIGLGLALFARLEGRELNGLTPHFLGLFMLGVLAAAIAFAARGSALDRLRRLVQWRLLTALLAGSVLAGVFCGLSDHIFGLRCAVLDTVVGATTASLLVALATRPEGALHRLVSSRPLVTVGTFSYSLYLIHAPLLQLVLEYGLRPLHLGEVATFALLAGVGAPLIVGAAWLFYLAVEKPFASAAPAPQRLCVS